MTVTSVTFRRFERPHYMLLPNWSKWHSNVAQSWLSCELPVQVSSHLNTMVMSIVLVEFLHKHSNVSLIESLMTSLQHLYCILVVVQAAQQWYSSDLQLFILYSWLGWYMLKIYCPPLHGFQSLNYWTTLYRWVSWVRKSVKEETRRKCSA